MEALKASVHIVYALPFAICEMCNLGINKLGESGGVWAWHVGVSACSWAFVQVVKDSGVNVNRACCQMAMMGLSVGVFVYSCS